MPNFSSKDAESIVALLTRIYLDIVEIENRFGLIAGEGDMRPRIDYFHDAVRAFTMGDVSHRRLNVELLSYDLRCLRYIQQMPLAPFKPAGANLSPAQAIMTGGPGLLAAAARPDRATRERIVELYQHYAVMFAALLKPAADQDYKQRTDSLNNDAQDIHALIQQFEGKGDLNAIAGLVQQLEEEQLRVILMTFLQQGKHKNAGEVKKLIGHLKNQVKSADKAIKSLDAAHMEFATAQLGIFEESKDMLKKLATQGMNLVGRFVQNAIAETKRQMGR